MTSENAGQQRALLYARVSTDDKGQNPEAQIQVMRKWCSDNDVAIVGEYIDEKSGKDMDRPQFQAAIGRITTSALSMTSEKINLLVAWNISRISRDQADFLNLSKMLASVGCHIRFVNESTKPETMEGQLIATIGAWQAEQERKKISENTKMALRQRKAAGKHNARPLRLVFQEDIDAGLYKAEGMLRFDDKVKHKTKITTMPDVLAWASEGLSLRAIALTKLYVPQSTFYELLKETGRLEAVKRAYDCSARVVIDKGKKE